MKMDNDNVLVTFPPILRSNFKELISTGKIGLSYLSLTDISSVKQYSQNNSSYGYYFTLRIPYAGKRLSWDLIFDPEDLYFAPDFNFNDDSFHMSTDVDTVLENIPTLSHWNVNNPKHLLAVLKEFHVLFKKQQLEKLQQDNIYAQLNAAYQVLKEEVCEDDIEIYLENSCAHFLINIKVDVSTLPEYIQPTQNGTVEILNPGDDTCSLKISYLKLDGSRLSSSLQLSPRLDQVLGSVRSLHIPNFTRSISLADYVDVVIKLVQDHVKNIEEHHKLKKEYITCMCAMYPGNIIEFDSETFSKGELLYQVDGYQCLVRIEIDELFPEEAPLVTLQSVYCVPSKKVCSEQIDYAYHPKWNPEHMLKKLMVSLKEAVPKFKSHKH